jgi:hypothetical protein
MFRLIPHYLREFLSEMKKQSNFIWNPWLIVKTAPKPLFLRTSVSLAKLLSGRNNLHKIKAENTQLPPAEAFQRSAVGLNPRG